MRLQVVDFLVFKINITEQNAVRKKQIFVDLLFFSQNQPKFPPLLRIHLNRNLKINKQMINYSSDLVLALHKQGSKSLNRKIRRGIGYCSELLFDIYITNQFFLHKILNNFQ